VADNGTATEIQRRLEEIRGPDEPANRELLVRIVDAFLIGTPAHEQRLADAVTAHDADAVRQEAHSLKGAAGNVGASELTDRCLGLEELGRSGELEAAGAALDGVRVELDQVRAILRDIVTTL
jgi:HPt (histidine-containing phosphotransfer) domain-containing protein